MLWQDVVRYVRQLLSLTRELQQAKEDIRSLREENKELRQRLNQHGAQFGDMALFAERVVSELQRTQERSETDKRLLRLEMENLVLRYVRGLPAELPQPESHDDDRSP